jgi:hypothetical protein
VIGFGIWVLGFGIFMSCPVCFNASVAEESVRASLNVGILVLMGVTGVVLAGFLRFIISIARRSREAVGADLQVRPSLPV